MDFDHNIDFLDPSYKLGYKDALKWVLAIETGCADWIIGEVDEHLKDIENLP